MSTSSIDCDMASTENKINVFAQRLKESRLKADISRAELSRRTGISEITLSSYEISDSLKKPTLGKVVLIAKALNVSLDWLCGLSDIPSIESESKQIPIDVATLLRAIAEFTVNHKSGTIAISSLSDYLNEDDREYFSQDYKIGSLIIISDRISAFLDDLIQLKALSDSGILADELFDMCVKQLVLRTAKQIEKDEKVI